MHAQGNLFLSDTMEGLMCLIHDLPKQRYSNGQYVEQGVSSDNKISHVLASAMIISFKIEKVRVIPLIISAWHSTLISLWEWTMIRQNVSFAADFLWLLCSM